MESITNIFIFIYIRGASITTNIGIFIFIYIYGISITTRVFIFVCTRGTSIITSTGTSSFAIFLIMKLVCTILCFQSVHTMICLLILYPLLILPHGFIIKIFRRLRMAFLTDLVKKVKTKSFRAMFNQSIVVSLKYYTLSIMS